MVVTAVVLMMTACQQNEPVQSVSFPLSICLPVEESLTATQAPLRKPGDPGSTERFLLPSHIYIFIVRQTGVDSWSVWGIIERSPSSGDWEKQYYSGPLMGDQDSIYRYKENIIMPLPSEGDFYGRIYAIASAEALSFDATIKNDGTSSLENLLNLRFSTTSSLTMPRNLQHIYSTPYNYEVNSAYYGSFTSVGKKVPNVYLMLYHVAAKVDITWSVAQNMRINRENPSAAVRLTGMKACNLFNGNAYCFRPMENSSGATPLAPAAGTGDTIAIVGAADEGLWWEGRSYFYTIPYTTTGKEGYYPLQMEMETNNSGNKYRPTIYLQVNTSSPFVPWLRATFNLNAPLNAGIDTKEGNLPAP